MSEDVDARGLRNHVATYRRFYRRSPIHLPGPELSGPWLWLRKKLDGYLTVDPTGKRLELTTEESIAEYRARTDQSFAEAIEEFRQDGPEYYEAWFERIQAYPDWLSSRDARKARNHSVLASFIGIFVSHTGFYPTKISGFGLEFPTNSKTGLCMVLIVCIAYLTGAYNSMLRDYTIAASCLEIKHSVENKNKCYTNRWAKYIMAQQSEKSFYERRLPNALAFYAAISLLFQ
jgi:hypothetical protein